MFVCMDRINEVKRDPRGQGDQGELAAIVWLMERGLPVFMPIGHSPDYDLVTDFGDRPVRIQVKTSMQRDGSRWHVAVCTRGGNRSWSGLVKYLNPSSYDYLFVLVGEGRRWFIPAHEVGGTTRIVVGGNKYSEYELSRGQPLRVGPPSLDSSAPWRDSRAVKGDAL
jgi:PD-(D/E)XK endonuclease